MSPQRPQGCRKANRAQLRGNLWAGKTTGRKTLLPQGRLPRSAGVVTSHAEGGDIPHEEEEIGQGDVWLGFTWGSALWAEAPGLLPDPLWHLPSMSLVLRTKPQACRGQGCSPEEARAELGE